MGSMNEKGNKCISLAMHLTSLTAFVRVRLYLVFTFDLFHFTFYPCCFEVFVVSEFVPIIRYSQVTVAAVKHDKPTNPTPLHTGSVLSDKRWAIPRILLSRTVNVWSMVIFSSCVASSRLILNLRACSSYEILCTGSVFISHITQPWFR